jgi:Na+-transporting NADH:ubiquinone oxidoreductase subunit B
VGGCVGETSSLAILIGAVILLLTGIANWRSVAGGMLSLSVCSLLLHTLVSTAIPPPAFQLLAGGWMFGIVFMVTDPVSGPLTRAGKWAYGILIGTLTLLIRTYSGFVEGVMFAILFGNICAPLMDTVVMRIKNKTYRAERRWR